MGVGGRCEFPVGRLWEMEVLQFQCSCLPLTLVANGWQPGAAAVQGGSFWLPFKVLGWLLARVSPRLEVKEAVTALAMTEQGSGTHRSLSLQQGRLAAGAH